DANVGHLAEAAIGLVMATGMGMRRDLQQKNQRHNRQGNSHKCGHPAAEPESSGLKSAPCGQEKPPSKVGRAFEGKDTTPLLSSRTRCSTRRERMPVFEDI